MNAIRSSAFYVNRTVRHVVGLLDVREDDERRECERPNCLVALAPPELLCVGEYDDLVVWENGQLRFRQKHCIYDGDLVIDSIVYPL